MALIRLVIIGYILAILGVVILSWFPQEPGSATAGVFQFLRRITEPVLGRLRQVLPPVGGMLDLSPMIALFVLTVLLNLVS